MKKVKSIWIIFVFALIGVLFSGYLTFTKMVLGVCPLTESCPYLFGQPVCIYGFGMFLLLLVFSGLMLFNIKKKFDKTFKLNKGILCISFAGILFSGYYAVQELFFTSCYGGKCDYSLGLPSCVYGFVMYVIIFVLSFLILKSKT